MFPGLIPAGQTFTIAVTLLTNILSTILPYVVTTLGLFFTVRFLLGYGRKSMLEGLRRRAVFITGCDSGFGKALALQLDSMGVPVYAACLTTDGKEQLTQQCSERLTAFSMDVTSTDDIVRVYGIVCKDIANATDGRCLWGVVNNAGILGDFGTTEMYTKADFVKVMDVNFFGQVEVIRTFLPLLKKSKGRIVNIASIAGVFPHSSLGFPCPYTPSKYAVVGYSDALRFDLEKWGIGVSVLLPGGHRTGIVSIDAQVRRFETMWDRLPADVKEEYGENWITSVCNEYKKLDKLLQQMPGVEPVVEAYTHALLSPHPKHRYIVGVDAQLQNVIKLLPQRMIDIMTHGPLNVLPHPLPAALKPQCSNVHGSGSTEVETAAINISTVAKESNISTVAKESNISTVAQESQISTASPARNIAHSAVFSSTTDMLWC